MKKKSKKLTLVGVVLGVLVGSPILASLATTICHKDRLFGSTNPFFKYQEKRVDLPDGTIPADTFIFDKSEQAYEVPSSTDEAQSRMGPQSRAFMPDTPGGGAYVVPGSVNPTENIFKHGTSMLYRNYTCLDWGYTDNWRYIKHFPGFQGISDWESTFYPKRNTSNCHDDPFGAYSRSSQKIWYWVNRYGTAATMDYQVYIDWSKWNAVQGYFSSVQAEGQYSYVTISSFLTDYYTEFNDDNDMSDYSSTLPSDISASTIQDFINGNRIKNKYDSYSSVRITGYDNLRGTVTCEVTIKDAIDYTGATTTLGTYTVTYTGLKQQQPTDVVSANINIQSMDVYDLDKEKVKERIIASNVIKNYLNSPTTSNIDFTVTQLIPKEAAIVVDLTLGNRVWCDSNGVPQASHVAKNIKLSGFKNPEQSGIGTVRVSQGSTLPSQSWYNSNASTLQTAISNAITGRAIPASSIRIDKFVSVDPLHGTMTINATVLGRWQNAPDYIRSDHTLNNLVVYGFQTVKPTAVNTSATLNINESIIPTQFNDSKATNYINTNISTIFNNTTPPGASVKRIVSIANDDNSKSTVQVTFILNKYYGADGFEKTDEREFTITIGGFQTRGETAVDSSAALTIGEAIVPTSFDEAKAKTYINANKAKIFNNTAPSDAAVNTIVSIVNDDNTKSTVEVTFTLTKYFDNKGIEQPNSGNYTITIGGFETRKPTVQDKGAKLQISEDLTASMFDNTKATDFINAHIAEIFNNTAPADARVDTIVANNNTDNTKRTVDVTFTINKHYDDKGIEQPGSEQYTVTISGFKVLQNKPITASPNAPDDLGKVVTPLGSGKDSNTANSVVNSEDILNQVKEEIAKNPTKYFPDIPPGANIDKAGITITKDPTNPNGIQVHVPINNVLKPDGTSATETPTITITGFKPASNKPASDAANKLETAIPEFNPADKDTTTPNNILRDPDVLGEVKNEIGSKPNEYFPDLPEGSIVKPDGITITQNPSKPGVIEVNVPIQDASGKVETQTIEINGFKPNPTGPIESNPNAQDALGNSIEALNPTNKPTHTTTEIMKDPAVEQQIKDEIAKNPDKYFPDLPPGVIINPNDITITPNPTNPDGLDINVPITKPNGVVDTPVIHVDGFKPTNTDPSGNAATDLNNTIPGFSPTVKPTTNPSNVSKDPTVLEDVKNEIAGHPDKYFPDLPPGATIDKDNITITEDPSDPHGVTITVPIKKPDGTVAKPTINIGGFEANPVDPISPKPNAGTALGTVVPEVGDNKGEHTVNQIINNPTVNQQIKDEIAANPNNYFDSLPPGSHVDKNNITITPNPTKPNGIDINVPIIHEDGSKETPTISIDGFKPSTTNPSDQAVGNLENAIPAFKPANKPNNTPNSIAKDPTILDEVKNEIASHPDKYFPDLPPGSSIDKDSITITPDPDTEGGIKVNVPITDKDGTTTTPSISIGGFKPNPTGPITPAPNADSELGNAIPELSDSEKPTHTTTDIINDPSVTDHIKEEIAKNPDKYFPDAPPGSTINPNDITIAPNPSNPDELQITVPITKPDGSKEDSVINIDGFKPSSTKPSTGALDNIESAIPQFSPTNKPTLTPGQIIKDPTVLEEVKNEIANNTDKYFPDLPPGTHVDKDHITITPNPTRPNGVDINVPIVNDAGTVVDTPQISIDGFKPSDNKPATDATDRLEANIPQFNPSNKGDNTADNISKDPTVLEEVKNEIANNVDKYFPDLAPGATIDKDNITITVNPTDPNGIEVNVPITNPDGTSSKPSIPVNGFRPAPADPIKPKPGVEEALGNAVPPISSAQRPNNTINSIISNSATVDQIKNEIAAHPENYFDGLPSGSTVDKNNITITPNPTKPNGIDINVPIKTPDGLTQTPTITVDGFKPSSSDPVSDAASKLETAVSGLSDANRPNKKPSQVASDTTILNDVKNEIAGHASQYFPDLAPGATIDKDNITIKPDPTKPGSVDVIVPIKQPDGSIERPSIQLDGFNTGNTNLASDAANQLKEHVNGINPAKNPGTNPSNVSKDPSVLNDVKNEIVNNPSRYFPNLPDGAVIEGNNITITEDATDNTAVNVTIPVRKPDGTVEKQVIQINGFTPNPTDPITDKPNAGEILGNKIPQVGSQKPNNTVNDIINNPTINQQIKDEIAAHPENYFDSLPSGSTVDKNNISITVNPSNPNGIEINVPITKPDGSKETPTISIDGFKPGSTKPSKDAASKLENNVAGLNPSKKPTTTPTDIVKNPNILNDVKNEIGNKPSEYFPDLPSGSSIDKNNITITQDPSKPGSVDVNVPIYDADGNKTDEVIHLSGFKPNPTLSGNTNPAPDAAAKLEAAVSGLSDANRPTKYPSDVAADTEILQNVKNEIATNPNKYFPNLPDGAHINKGDIALVPDPTNPDGLNVSVPITLPNGIVETPTIHLDGFKPGRNEPTTTKPLNQMQQALQNSIIASGDTLVKDKLEADPSLLDKIQTDLNNAVQHGDLADQLFDGLNANGHTSTVSFGKPELNADGDIQVEITVDGWFNGKDYENGHVVPVVIPTVRPAKDPDTSKPIAMPHGLSDVTVVPNKDQNGFQSLDSSNMTSEQITDVIKQEIANSFNPAGAIKPDQIHINNANSNIWDGTSSLDITVDNWVDPDGNIVPSHPVNGLTISGFKPAQTALKPNAIVKVPGLSEYTPDTIVGPDGHVLPDVQKEILTQVLQSGVITGLDPSATVEDLEISSYDPNTGDIFITIKNNKAGKDGASVSQMQFGTIKLTGFYQENGFINGSNQWWIFAIIALNIILLLILLIILVIYSKKVKTSIDELEAEENF